MFVPDGFVVPRQLAGEGLLLVPLGPEHTEQDLAATWPFRAPAFPGRD